MNLKALLQPKVLATGKFGLHDSGPTEHTFHLPDAGGATITCFWHNSDLQYHFYKGIQFTPGNSANSKTWQNAWNEADKEPWIRVDHKTNEIAILVYGRL